MVGVLNGRLLQESISFVEIMTTVGKHYSISVLGVLSYEKCYIDVLVYYRPLDHDIYSGGPGVDQS